jgi:hypothetical protein
VSREEVVVVALLVILIAVLWRKNVRAIAKCGEWLSFTLEARDPTPAPVPKSRRGEADNSQP